MSDQTPLDCAREGCPKCRGNGVAVGYLHAEYCEVVKRGAGRCDCGKWGPHPCPECARVAKLIEEAEERATERAKRAVCGYCEADWPFDGEVHMKEIFVVECFAAPIRRAAKETRT